MRILRNIIITLLLFAIATVAVVGAMIEMPPVLGWTPDRVNALGRSFLEVMRPRNGLLFFWLALALSTLLVFLMTISRPRKPMKFEVQMGGGRVIIMDTAIKKYIRNALSELADVTVKKIDLREVRGGIEANVTADVRTRENLPVLERRIIQRVRSALTEEMGISNLNDVHVYIRDFEVTGRPVKGHPDKAEAKRPGREETIREESNIIAAAPAAAGTMGSVIEGNRRDKSTVPVGDGDYYPDDKPVGLPPADDEATPAWAEASTASAADDSWTADAPAIEAPSDSSAPIAGPAGLDQRPGTFNDTTINFGGTVDNPDRPHVPVFDPENPNDKPLDTSRG